MTGAVSLACPAQLPGGKVYRSSLARLLPGVAAAAAAAAAAGAWPPRDRGPARGGNGSRGRPASHSKLEQPCTFVTRSAHGRAGVQEPERTRGRGGGGWMGVRSKEPEAAQRDRGPPASPGADRSGFAVCC